MSKGEAGEILWMTAEQEVWQSELRQAEVQELGVADAKRREQGSENWEK
jgi:hypothetical protein